MAGTGIEAERLREERDAARDAKNWGQADELRDAIRKLGYDVVDESSGSRLVPL
jgi:cysteinyl-tRNA synthetase